MRLLRIRATNFLSFGKTINLQVDADLTALTGPNGVGKSNVGRCLDLVRNAAARAAGASNQLEIYEDAGHKGIGAYHVMIDLELDQAWERTLVLIFTRAAYTYGGGSPNLKGRPSAMDLDRAVGAWLIEDSLAPLWSGALHVYFDSAVRSPWYVAWEFMSSGQTWHVVLQGGSSGQLRPGPADPYEPHIGTSSTLTDHLSEIMRPSTLDAPPSSDIAEVSDVDAITDAEESDKVMTDSELPTQLDFRLMLPADNKTLSFQIQPATDGSNLVPASIRELASALGVEDFHNKSFGFAQVIWEVLRHGVVLTDNRRRPLSRQFAYTDLSTPTDLRDGGNVAAELFRLKNGNLKERARYAEIESTFTYLTGRTLGLRSRPEPLPESSDGMVIEPTVVDDQSERLVEFSGAGIQEALVLSTLLPGELGRVIVLDEPAVNLEPTMQRRLISRLRGKGQFIVITHSADLVPVDQSDDLENIVRLAPSPNGTEVFRTHALTLSDPIKSIKLLAPNDVRALLFASAVILCEGSTEMGALPRWWADTTGLGLLDPGAANIAIIDVGGDSCFGSYVEYLGAFGIPWAIVADGPALRPESWLCKQLTNLNLAPRGMPDSEDDHAFEQWREYWGRAGVFTLARVFGDDGKKQGEFEAFLEQIDNNLLAEAKALYPRSKPHVGAYFATKARAPQRVLELYQVIMKRFPHIQARRKAQEPLFD